MFSFFLPVGANCITVMLPREAVFCACNSRDIGASHCWRRANPAAAITNYWVVSSYLIEKRRLGAMTGDLGKEVSSGKVPVINLIKARQTVLFYYRGQFSRYGSKLRTYPFLFSPAVCLPLISLSLCPCTYINVSIKEECVAKLGLSRLRDLFRASYKALEAE